MTLVEVMVGATLGLVIVSALVSFFVTTSRNNRELAQANRQIEAGRYAIQLLERDVVHAGFWGTYVPAFDDVTVNESLLYAAIKDAPTAVPSPCLAWDPAASPPGWSLEQKRNVIAIPVQAYDATPTGCSLPNRLANTDVLVVRYGALCEAGEAGCPSPVSPALYFQASQCNRELTYEPGPRRFVLDTSGFTLKKKGCRINSAGVSEQAADAPRRQFLSYIYYVRDYASAPGDGIPTLMRLDFGLSTNGKLEHLQPTVLVEGIDGFAVEIGVDDVSATNAQLTASSYDVKVAWQDSRNRSVATNRGDGSPDRYVRCTTSSPCTPLTLMNAVALRLHVLSRSLEPSAGHSDTKVYSLGDQTRGPFNDAFKRHVFTTSLRLHNVSGRR